MKAIYEKPIANIELNREKQTISSKVRNETRVPTLCTPTQHSLGIPSQSKKAGRRNRRNINKYRKKSKYSYLQMT
jgi:hypothetical protein